MAESSSKTETYGSWLGLREAVDPHARDHSLTTATICWLDSRPTRHLLDLGSGSGSNMRFLAPQLPGPQNWVLLDDAELLTHAKTTCQSLRDKEGQPVAITMRAANLSEPDWLALSGERFDLVTASALLDLVSEQWLDNFVGFCQAQGAAVLATLSYDGHFSFGRSHCTDSLVRDLVHAHQRKGKGFGPALGPDATTLLEQRMRNRGFTVLNGPSPWHLDHRHLALQVALVEYWTEAAIEQSPADRDIIEVWRGQRLQEAWAGQAQIEVGHRDVFAVPGGL